MKMKYYILVAVLAVIAVLGMFGYRYYLDSQFHTGLCSAVQQKQLALFDPMSPELVFTYSGTTYSCQNSAQMINTQKYLNHK